jgi:hypothetical protein
MANSSSSKYVKNRRHRHKHGHGRTKSRRHAKKYTIRKVMHGCSSNQNGGAVPTASPSGGTVVPMPHNAASLGGAGNIINGAKVHQQVGAILTAQGGNPSPYVSLAPKYVPQPQAQAGGYKSKHRRRRYKKSIGRKGRSRRFRGSRK